MSGEPFRPPSESLSRRYRFTRELGQGGWGVVYLAEDLTDRSLVAVKVLRFEAGRFGRERFLREIRIARTLDHPCIVPLRDSGEDGETLYFVMPYVAGETLEQRLQRERQLPLADVLRIADDVLDALAHAHAAGVVHRDIKPSNILLGGKRAMVADFGIARALTRSSPDEWVSSAGLQIGTPEYMSPEQAAAEDDLDGRSDLYSLGCVLYEMIGGVPPFTGAGASTVMARHSLDPVPPVRTLRPGLSRAIEAVVLRALAKRPADRFASAGEMREALATAAASGAEQRDAPGWRRRGPRLAVAAGIITALGYLAWSGSITPRGTAGAAVDSTNWAVFPFAQSAAPASAADGAQLLSNALRAWNGLTLVDPIDLRHAMLADSGALSTDRASHLAEELGAGRFVRGRVSGDGDSVLVQATLYDTRTGALAEATEHAATSKEDLDRGFARLAFRLLFRDAIRADARVVSGTRSLPAGQSFLAARDALNAWDLGRADSLLSAAVNGDDQFAEAWLWLALVRMWQGRDPSEWNYAAMNAASASDALDARAQALAAALRATAQEALPRACALFDGLAVRDSFDFAAWYSAAVCQSSDHVVIRDAASPSGWRFRTSYRAALARYQRAWQLRPAVLRTLRTNAFEPLRKLLKTNGNDVRLGMRPGSDSIEFLAYPSLDHDTLAFVAFPSGAVANADSAVLLSLPSSIPEAVNRQRRLFRDVATTWQTAYPGSAEAAEAVAVSYELLGDPASVAAMSRALTLSSDPAERWHILCWQVWLRLKFSIPDDVAGIREARLLADSLIDTAPPDRGDVAMLASLATLLGRGHYAARVFSDAVGDTPSDILPSLRPTWHRLLVYAALGGPADTLKALAAQADSVIRARIAPASVPDALQTFLGRAATLAVPDRSLASALGTEPSGDYLLDLVTSARRGDSAFVHAQLADVRRFRSMKAAADLSIDALLPEATLLAGSGDVRGAAAWLDPTLAALSGRSPLAFVDPVRAASLVRAMAFRADLAARIGDDATARRWAAAVAVLWSGADAFLQPLVKRMQRLSR